MSAKPEFPRDEMQRLFRKIAGRALPGEKGQQQMLRAARRLNRALAEGREIGARRAKAYWYGEIDDVPSDHMDRARELAFVQPLQEAHDAVAAAETLVRNARERLLERALRGAADAAAQPGVGLALALPAGLASLEDDRDLAPQGLGLSLRLITSSSP